MYPRLLEQNPPVSLEGIFDRQDGVFLSQRQYVEGAVIAEDGLPLDVSVVSREGVVILFHPHCTMRLPGGPKPCFAAGLGLGLGLGAGVVCAVSSIRYLGSGSGK